MSDSELGAASQVFDTREDLMRELDAFYELSGCLACMASADGRFQRLSKGWEDALGYSLDELVGQPWIKFVHPDDVKGTHAVASQMSFAAANGFVNRYRHKNGSWVTLSWRTTTWAGGRTYALVTVVK
jgi:PAS domain S-box-containing protein